MSRPRKPTKVLELSGAFERNPNRKRTSEPKPTGVIGPPPEHMSENEVDVWFELSNACFWATDADRQIMELAAILLCRFRADPEFKQMNHLLTALGKLGLTPSDRSKVSVPDKQGKKSKWAK